MSDDKTVRVDHPLPDPEKPLPKAKTYRFTAEDQARLANRDGSIFMRIQVGKPDIVADESQRSKSWLDK